MPSFFQQSGLDTEANGSYFYKVEFQRRAKTMPKGDLLGAFEQHVLLALIRLGDNAYGMTIRRQIEEKTKRSVSLGAVYATLDRLEGKNISPPGRGLARPREQGGRGGTSGSSGLECWPSMMLCMPSTPCRDGLPARLAPDQC